MVYPTAAGAADPHCIPTIVAHFEEYRGPAWCAERPKLVMLPPMSRTGSCRCCKREGPVYRVAEGQTVHAVQGTTVGKDHQVKRLGVELGEARVENHARGTSIVATSRPETENDIAFMSSVSRERLSAIGRDKQTAEIQKIMATYESKQSPDALKLIELGFYEPLLQWAIQYAMHTHGITAPWITEASPEAEDVNVHMQDVDVEMGTADQAASSSLPQPAPPPPPHLPVNQSAHIEPPGERRKRKQPMYARG